MAILSPSEWDKISWVLLDMDGTLLDLCFDDTLWRIAVPRAYAEHHQISEAEARHTIITIAEAAYGKLEWYCLDYWRDQVGFDIRPIKAELAHLIGFRNGALAFLKWLKHHNKQVVLATNAHPDSIALKDLHTDLSQWVDIIMDAHSAKAAKESPDYWHWLQGKTNYIGTQTLFIDDNDHILDAAAEAGIGHCIGVKTPNSQGKAYQSRYPAFDHFQELYLPSI
jgi:putative hydrolase of the HAD superfamily